jgi:glucose uptake protein
LGLWPNAFKLSGARWRFELFYIDFAVGALLFSVIAAYTFGTLGSNLGFSDRMLVAGRTPQVFMVAAGFVFNLGNTLLVASMSLLGMSAAFPLTVGLAVIVGSFLNFKTGSTGLLITAIVLMIGALIFDGIACRARDAATAGPPKSGGKRRSKRKMSKTQRGWITGLTGGLLLGLSYPIAQRGMGGEFNIGPYAGVLLLCVGMLISTIIFSFYFMNIAISGEPIAPGAYFQGTPKQHFIGFLGGAVWALGILAALLASSAAAQVGLPFLTLILPLESVLLVIVCGLLWWKEFATRAKTARIPLVGTVLLFAGALLAFGFGIVHS